ncbi:hypothetical protein Tcan_01157, partial [Toxocara canis]
MHFSIESLIKHKPLHITTFKCKDAFKVLKSFNEHFCIRVDIQSIIGTKNKRERLLRGITSITEASFKYSIKVKEEKFQKESTFVAKKSRGNISPLTTESMNIDCP